MSADGTVCPSCNLPLRCEACGVGEAALATNYINDDLQWIAIRVCARCEHIDHIAEADRIPADARAVELIAMTLRNLPAWDEREKRRTARPTP